MGVEGAGATHPDARDGVEQSADDKHTQGFGGLQDVLGTGLIQEPVTTGGGCDLHRVEGREDGNSHLDLVQRSEDGDDLGKVHFVHVDVDMQQGKSLHGTSLLQFAKCSSQDLVADSSVSKLQTQLLSGEVLQVLLPQVVALDQSLDGQGDASLLVTLEREGERGWVFKLSRPSF